MNSPVSAKTTTAVFSEGEAIEGVVLSLDLLNSG